MIWIKTFFAHILSSYHRTNNNPSAFTTRSVRSNENRWRFLTILRPTILLRTIVQLTEFKQLKRVLFHQMQPCWTTYTDKVLSSTPVNAWTTHYFVFMHKFLTTLFTRCVRFITTTKYSTHSENPCGALFEGKRQTENIILYKKKKSDSLEQGHF